MNGNSGVTEDDRNAEVVLLLANKALSLSSQVCALLPKMENFLGVSIAIIVGATSLGITQKHPTILVMLPFFLIILFVYLLQSNTEMLSRAGHMGFLEEKVNELLGTRVLLEESDVALTLQGRTKFGRLSIILIQLLMLVLLLGAVVLAIVNVHHVVGLAWRVTFWLSLAAGLATLAAAAREQASAYEAAYVAAKEGFDGVSVRSTALRRASLD